MNNKKCLKLAKLILNMLLKDKKLLKLIFKILEFKLNFL